MSRIMNGSDISCPTIRKSSPCRMRKWCQSPSRAPFFLKKSPQRPCTGRSSASASATPPSDNGTLAAATVETSQRRNLHRRAGPPSRDGCRTVPHEDVDARDATRHGKRLCVTNSQPASSAKCSPCQQQPGNRPRVNTENTRTKICPRFRLRMDPSDRARMLNCQSVKSRVGGVATVLNGTPLCYRRRNSKRRINRSVVSAHPNAPRRISLNPDDVLVIRGSNIVCCTRWSHERSPAKM